MVSGAMSALITPFKNGKIDTQTYEYLIKRQILFMLALTSFGSVLGALLSIMSGYDCIEILSDVTMSISLVAVVMILFTKKINVSVVKITQLNLQQVNGTKSKYQHSKIKY